MILNANNTVRWMNKAVAKGIPLIPNLIYFFNRVVFTCDIRPNVKIHSSLRLPHNALGVVINQNTTIGSGCNILHNVTIGGNMDKTKVVNDVEIIAPVIGDNVLIGVGAIIIGPIVIGDNTTIGAGAVVTKDIPPNSVVYSKQNLIVNSN